MEAVRWWDGLGWCVDPRMGIDGWTRLEGE